jgi:hypothetical protein
MCTEHQAAQRQVAELKQQVADVTAIATTAQKAAGQAKQDVDTLALVRRAFNALGVVAGDGTAAAVVDEDAIVAKVLARVPAGGAVVQVTPPEKLLADFQRAAVERIMTETRAWSPTARVILKFLEARGVRLRNGPIAQGAGRHNNGDLTAVLKELKSCGVVDIDGNGSRTILRDRIAGDLSVVSANDKQVEEVYQRVLYELATEGAEKAA